MFGTLADYIGRRPSFFLTHICILLASLGSACAQDYDSYVVLRFFVGLGVAGLGLMAFMVPAEVIGVKGGRGFYLTCQSAWFGAGNALLGPVAFLFPAWRTLTVVITLPHLMYLTCCACMAVESPRWLLTQGRGEDGYRGLQAMAASNGRLDKLPALDHIKVGKDALSAVDHFGDDPHATVSAWSLFQTEPTRTWTLVMMLVWFVNSFVFYGIGLNVASLSADPYVGCFVTGAVQVVAVPLFALVLDRVGRRASISGAMVAAGICCGLCAVIAVPPECELPGADCGPKQFRLVIAMFGDALMSSSFAAIFTYAGEIFPTEVRSSGMGLSSSSARVGGVTAPIVLMTASVWVGLPFIVFAVFGVVVGLMVLILPETLGAQLPDRLADAAMLSSKESKRLQRATGIEMSEFSMLGEADNY